MCSLYKCLIQTPCCSLPVRSLAFQEVLNRSQIGQCGVTIAYFSLGLICRLRSWGLP